MSITFSTSWYNFKSKFDNEIYLSWMDNMLSNVNNYNLVINCSSSNFITKKFFYKKINKDYNAVAFTTIIKHNKFSNNIASQYFTELGPLAFLPISYFTQSEQKILLKEKTH